MCKDTLSLSLDRLVGRLNPPLAVIFIFLLTSSDAFLEILYLSIDGVHLSLHAPLSTRMSPDRRAPSANSDWLGPEHADLAGLEVGDMIF